MKQSNKDQAVQLTLDKGYYCDDCKRTGTYFSLTLSTCPKCGSTNVTVSPRQ